MVLTDDSSLIARLITSWKTREEELRERIATDPTNSASWLWAIQLRICTYLLRRYGREQKSDPSPDQEAKDSVTIYHPLKTFHASVRAHSYDEREHRAKFRLRCQETLVRLQSLVADARTRSLQRADSEVKLARERCSQSRQSRAGSMTIRKEVAKVVMFMFVLWAILMILITLSFNG